MDSTPSSCIDVFAHDDTFTVKNEEDRLMNDNLVYMLFGGKSFIGKNLRAIVKSLQTRSISCLDVSSAKRSTELINHSTSMLKTAMGKRSLVVLHGIESLRSQDLEKLNYLYRVTDSTYEYSNVIVTLIWNNDTIPIHVHNRNYDENNYWRAVVSEIWSRNGSLVNGAALAGRISRSGIENCIDEYIPSSSGSSYNTSIQSNRLNDMQQLCDDLKKPTDVSLQFYVTGIIIIIMTVFAINFYYRQTKTSKREKSNIIMNKPDEPANHPHNTRSRGKTKKV